MYDPLLSSKPVICKSSVAQGLLDINGSRNTNINEVSFAEQWNAHLYLKLINLFVIPELIHYKFPK